MKMSFRYRFEAAHRLTSSSSPMCQTPHGHTWYITLHWRTSLTNLNKENMLAEFQQVKGPWKKFVQETVDHSFFYNESDPLAESMRELIPSFRGLATPGDPTTEILAVLFLKKSVQIAEAQKLGGTEPALTAGLEPYAVDLQETEVNSVSVDVDSEIYQEAIKTLPLNGWWNSSKTNDRTPL